MDDVVEVHVLPGLSEISAAEWDSCACPESEDGGRPYDPFTTHRFLKALEDSRSVGPGTGWEPRYLAARSNGELIAVAPLYAKSHSQGEYIFDFSWAHAYENAGGHYYPKLQIAVPFTPATGRRFLVKPGFETAGMSALVQGAVQLAADSGLSSVHVTFCTEAEALAGEAMGLMRRVSQQFHWVNRGYATFGDFLASLSSRKRKTIRKERERAQAFGGEIRSLTGDDIEPHHWESFWRFYQDTGSRKWGRPYLTRQFFDIAHETLRDDVLMVMCNREGRDVAGAMNLIGRDVLYGRYWGAIEHHDCLHFEACYYRAIDFAIVHRMRGVEAGAQGEHKLARGYLPAECHSLHWIGDAGFARAVKRFLDEERHAVEEDMEVLTAYGPFRRDQREEQD